jgi:MFS family permease
MLKTILDNHGLRSWVPKIEKTTFDVSFVHFLLMFGYKLFSLFYPLYLASVGVSLLNIGNIYFLTYLIISVSCFVINFYIRRVNPARLAALGILGYGVFALLMLISQNIYVFYLAQFVLGVSAAAWLVSLKFILMNSKTESRTKSFGWFYSMPDYATAIAPAIGGIIIWKYGFRGVFFASVIIQLFNAVYAYSRLKFNGAAALKFDKENCVREKEMSQIKRYREVFRMINDKKNILVMLSFIFASLILSGIYRAFFVLMLKDFSFPQSEVITFMSAISFVYVPFSILVIKTMGKFKKVKIVSGGIVLEGFTAVIFGIFYSALSHGAIFILNILDSMGELAMGSGKSAFFAKKLENFKQEASTIDSVMTTLGPALGGIVGGISVSVLGYQKTFLIAGAIVTLMGLYSFFMNFEERKPKYDKVL